VKSLVRDCGVQRWSVLPCPALSTPHVCSLITSTQESRKIPSASDDAIPTTTTAAAAAASSSSSSSPTIYQHLAPSI